MGAATVYTHINSTQGAMNAAIRPLLRRNLVEVCDSIDRALTYPLYLPRKLSLKFDLWVSRAVIKDDPF